MYKHPEILFSILVGAMYLFILITEPCECIIEHFNFFLIGRKFYDKVWPPKMLAF